METKVKETEIEIAKRVLHQIIDELSVMDYCEYDYRVQDINTKPNVVIQIYIEKGGNISIKDRNSLFKK